MTDKNKAAYDAKYASGLSMQLDILLIIETLVSVIKRDGIFKTEQLAKLDKDAVKND
ncbi:hypothetical protein [Leuconostoc lactis]|uniref:hypothetical protein n=1 Tax=Leuconostoc lactis TaxID=1246 RepID=UPI0028AE5B36|nr:hypothetical protein [Leuconostoc lactis]